MEDGYQNQKQGAGVEVTAGTLVNCVVRNCTGVNGSRGMVYLGGDNASCFNCVLTNYKGSAYGGGQRPGGCLCVTKGKAANCWDNACDGGGETGYDVVFPADTNGNYIKDRLSVLDACVARYAPNDTCIAADDVPATGDFRTPLPGSPVIDAGADLDWLPQTDLKGNPRVFGTGLDAGCYE